MHIYIHSMHTQSTHFDEHSIHVHKHTTLHTPRHICHTTHKHSTHLDRDITHTQSTYLDHAILYTITSHKPIQNTIYTEQTHIHIYPIIHTYIHKPKTHI